MADDDDDEPKPRLRPNTPGLWPGPIPERLQPWLDKAQANLAAPYRGIVSEGRIEEEFFTLASTGVSLQPLIDAAAAFLDSLGVEHRSQASFPPDSDVWRGWNNMHLFVMRHGVCLEHLGQRQRELALNLLRVSVSDSAFATARDVMRLNEHLREITGRTDEFGEWFYWIAVIGTPSPTEPWGWQIDGHHLTVSAFVCGDQFVMTPSFMGSEPVHARSGKYAGTRVFAAEELEGLAVMQALTSEQQARATIGMQIPADVFAGATFDNLDLPYEGMPYPAMSAASQALLLQLIELYVGRVRRGHAAIQLAQVKRHLDRTWFAWIGHHDDTSVFYYRVHSPVILIEFDHQAGVALVNPTPTRGHIHTMVRTPNGNDFGQALRRQSLKRSPG